MNRLALIAITILFASVSARADDAPRVVRENIEWLDVWIPGNGVKDQPRVLLVGDSITRAYYKTVETKLQGKAIVCRLATSKSLGDPSLLDEVKLVLGQAKFDVIHFNNGMHGWGYTEEEYAKAIPDLIATIRKNAPQARLICATTTPVRVNGKLDQLDPKTDRVKVRNKSASELMAKEKIPVNDLFAVVDKAELFSNDGVHMNAKGTTALGEQVAAEVLKSLETKAPEKPVEASLSPFGIGACHIHNRSTEDFSRWVPQMSAIGISNHRTCNTSWGAVEPEEGKWNWDNLDNQMKYMDDQKIRYGALLSGTPRWNKLDKPGTLPVNNVTGWSNYATELAKHVKGRVSYFEIWNEPPNGTGKDQTPADYAKLVAAAYKAIKAVDPEMKIGLSAKSAHVNYLEQVIKAGAKDHFDYIVLHPYEILNGIADNAGSEAVYMHIVPTVRRMLAAQNPTKKDVPIIFTELGSDSKKGADNQAHALVKAYTMGIAQGVTCIQWFEGRDGDSGPMGLIDGKGNPRPAYTAYAQMIKHLGQHPTYLGWLLLNDKNYGFVFQGAKGTVLVTWSPKGDPNKVEFGQDVQIIDPLTAKTSNANAYDLTFAPILVLGVPDKLVTLAKANKTRPFPWGGDFTNAKSVTITYDGDKTVEKGLHTISGAAVAEAIVAYGGSARAGNVPGGNLFIVDPNFLNYSSTPIEITAVVRRNPANENAGFKLIYESKTGFKTAGGWYTVPDNKQWHTIKWKIDDAQFVNYWGYNFNLESDGNKFNKYYIQSITVTKREK